MTDYILPDVLQTNLNIVFCGTAASAKSAQVKAYYAGPGNLFWETVYKVGLTPYQLKPQEFTTLTQYGIGLTDLAKHTVGNDSILSKDDFDNESLKSKISLYAPKILAFTSKRAASVFYNLPTSQLHYGQQTQPFESTIVFILPSPSGAARGYWDIASWQLLAAFTRIHHNFE